MNKAVIIGLLLFFISCNYFKPEEKEGAVARVNDEYLYIDDLSGIVPAGSTKEDSLAIMHNYIDRWAARKLMLKAADVNLSENRRAEFDALVAEYEADLYTKAYMEELVSQSVDTIVSDAEMEVFYKANKDNFRTNGVLVRMRYLHLANDNPKFGLLRSKFFDFRKSDQKFWDDNLMMMKSASLNDSAWIELSAIYSRLPFITPENRDRFVRAGKSIEHSADGDTYLIKITGVLDVNQPSPFEYVKPTLRDIIINRRKLELIKKFEKEITGDAIKDNKYEIYK